MVERINDQANASGNVEDVISRGVGSKLFEHIQRIGQDDRHAPDPADGLDQYDWSLTTHLVAPVLVLSDTAAGQNYTGKALCGLPPSFSRLKTAGCHKKIPSAENSSGPAACPVSSHTVSAARGE